MRKTLILLAVVTLTLLLLPHITSAPPREVKSWGGVIAESTKCPPVYDKSGKGNYATCSVPLTRWVSVGPVVIPQGAYKVSTRREAKVVFGWNGASPSSKVVFSGSSFHAEVYDELNGYRDVWVKRFSIDGSYRWRKSSEGYSYYADYVEGGSISWYMWEEPCFKGPGLCGFKRGTYREDEITSDSYGGRFSFSATYTVYYAGFQPTPQLWFRGEAYAGDEGDGNGNGNGDEEGKFKLTIIVKEGKGTTSPSPGVHYYEPGTVVTISQSPAKGYVFDSWYVVEHGIYYKTRTLTLVMDGDYTVYAYFVKKSNVCWRLHVDSSPSGMPVRVGERVYTTPVVLVYRAKRCVPRYGKVKRWRVTVEALGNGSWFPVSTEFWFEGRYGWEGAGSVRDVDGLLEARIYNDGRGRPVYRYYYYYDDTRYFYAGDRWWFEDIKDVKLFFRYENSSRLAFLTVKTSIDDLLQNEVVRVNGTPVPTPWEVYGDRGVSATLEADEVYAHKVYKLRKEWVRCYSVCTYSYELRGELTLEFDYYISKDGYVEVYADGVRVLRVKGYHYPKVKRGHARLSVALNDNVTISLRKASLSGLEAYEEKRYLFEKWYVYDGTGNILLDAPRVINVSVPVGEHYTTVAVYRYEGATLEVDSHPSGVAITYNSTTRVTPFTLTSEDELTVRLEAPQEWGSYVFTNWTVYTGSGSTTYETTEIALTVPRGESWRAVAYYSEGGEKNYTTYRLSGEVYHLPYQWVAIPANLTPGLYLINSTPIPPNPSNKTLIYGVLMGRDGAYMLVPALNLWVNVSSETSLPALRCVGEECEPVYAVEAVNFSGYYLVGLGVMNWVDPEDDVRELASLLLPNGTTIAVYNVSLYGEGAAYWKPVVVTSIKAEVWGYYEERGVYLVWNVSYTHLAPQWLHEYLNVTEPLRPYQGVKCRLYREGRVWVERELGVVPGGLELPDSQYYSYAAAYLSYEELREELGFDECILKAAVTWTAMDIPFSISSRVTFAPAGIELRDLEYGDEWTWEVAPVEIPNNTPGDYLALNGRLVVYFNGTREEYSPVPAGYDLYRFTTPPFEIGYGTLETYYVPPKTKNVIYYFYPFRF